MTDGRKGVNKEHAGTDILHHRTDFLTLLRRITMYRATAAACLVVPFGAMVKSLVRIVQKRAAVVAQTAAFPHVIPAAVYFKHLRYDQFLLFYPFHFQKHRKTADLARPFCLCKDTALSLSAQIYLHE